MATAQDLIDEVRFVIHDESPTYRWSDAELLDYINAGVRQIIQVVPEANAVREAVQISTQLAKQTLPSGGISLIKVGRNASTDGTTFEGVIRRVEKDVLDSYDPDWEYDTTVKADAANYFVHWAHDPAEPKVYYLYPAPAAATRYVELVYAKVPTALDSVDDTFPLADEYWNAGVMYTVYRALTKESRDTMPDSYRQELWNNFLTSLGIEKAARRQAIPPQPPEAE